MTFLGGGTQISATLSKDQPDTELLALMRKEGAERVRTALGSYVSFLKTGKTLLHTYVYVEPNSLSQGSDPLVELYFTAESFMFGSSGSPFSFSVSFGDLHRSLVALIPSGDSLHSTHL